ncbi:hypothetical protein PK35_04405 [Tamlana nanhaiensis]|uniref:Anti-bacteriophage protein A/HamA C-terminal domain-containing protein n=1 Tax=Neotamlana nanhaiensis TaxID=1382798 RepID=A0A0D7W4M1_9FLAO|nr:DUF1837 domain-containing protein [Tamlana nanhaiensis]KJD33984.1 hypothetical protein PK35_04405 [Tamlana nanhaiensis]
MNIESLKTYTENQIFKFEYSSTGKFIKNSFHLDYLKNKYRETDLISLIRDTVPYFALTEEEFEQLESIDQTRIAWSRISKARKDKKGDYGELLLFLILLIYYDAPKLVTKVRLRTSMNLQINGYDCAHFTIENDEPVLWIGESKFYQDFSSALTKSISSLNDHCNIISTTDELSILKPNIEINKNSHEDFIKLQSLFKGKSIDRIKFKVPVLLTYNSKCIKNNDDISDKFKTELREEIDNLYNTIETKDIQTDLRNVDFIFFLFPFDAVSYVKDSLENIENALRT